MFIVYLILLFLLMFSVVKIIYPMVIDSYFKGDKFLAVKNRIQQHIDECNELNEHIESLKLSYAYVQTCDYGEGQLSDTSSYNMKRKQWATKLNNKWTHQCSASIVKNASDQPYKYFCKYFNINADEATLKQFEKVLNDFSAVEQGKLLLANERDAILLSIRNSIPSHILKNHHARVVSELGFKNISMSQLYFPSYAFQYISAGGNSSSQFVLTFDIAQIERFIVYLAGLLKIKNSIAGQRALMTSNLRERIKNRDGYTCQICRLSTKDEKNLLLEIDHIIPLSKGGVTCESNLQTLCWKCNRSKGSKVYSADVVINPLQTGSERLDTTLPPKVSVSTGSAKSDKTWLPNVSASTDSAKSETTLPPKVSAPTDSAKLDMTRPPKTRMPATVLQNSTFEGDVASNTETKQKSGLSRPQANALRSAKEYLECSGYSRKGLIEQLHAGDGYDVSDATIAVDSLNIEWKKQAVKSAKEYLDCSGYSCKGLIEQLHKGDGYTLSEATYGAEQAGACS